MGSKKDGTGRTRNFVSILYPESAPENWLSILREQCVAAFVSPLHDNDFNDQGEKKKPHYHVMIMFDSVKYIEQAQELYDLIGAIKCEKCKSLRGSARYLCHLDNPEKALYDRNDIICVAGADYEEVISLACDRYEAISEMIDFIEVNDITNFYKLLEIVREEHFDWFRILCDNGTYVIKEAIKSRARCQKQMTD